MLHLHLFGAPSVRAAGQPVGGAAAQPRRLAMLALLARAGDRGITRDKVIGTLWPDLDEERARRALTHALYALRRDLGSEDAIEGSRDLRLNPALVTSDLAEFLQAIAEGRASAAAAAYAGPLMDGFHVTDAPEFERWLDTERSHLAAEYADLLEQLADTARTAGDHRAAAGWWRKRAASDPLYARIALALMRSLADAGDRSAALKHAAIFETLLEQELGQPQDQAVATYAAQLRAQPTAMVAPPPPPAPVADAVPVPAAAPMAATPPAGAPEAKRRGPSTRAWLALGAVAAVGVIAAIVVARRPRGTRIPRVAVGRVVDYRDSTQLAGPLTDLLATSLARIPGIQMVSMSRLYELAQEAGGADTSAAALVAAARRADASEIVDGALYPLPDGRLRLDLRRVDIASGGVLGATRVEARDLFALVDSGTAALARAFGGPAPSGSIAQLTTRSEAAARLYADGLRAFSAGNRSAAEELFGAALAEDSNFAMAEFYHARTSDDPVQSIARLRRAQRLSQRASERERLLIAATVALGDHDPALPFIADTLARRFPAELEGHLYLGQALIAKGDFLGAVPELEQAIALAGPPVAGNPECRECDAWNALVAAWQLADSLDEAVRISERWTARRPASPQAWLVLGGELHAAGRFEEGLAAWRRASALSPDLDDAILLGTSRIWREDYAGAERGLRERVAAGGRQRGDALWLLTIDLRYQGRLRDALAAARAMRSANTLATPRGSVPQSASQEAQVLLEMGQPARAAALFDSVARFTLPQQALPSQYRSRAWFLTHAAEAWIEAGDLARGAQLADSIELLAARGISGRDQLMHHAVRGRLALARGDTATAIRELSAAVFSRTLGYTRAHAELARLLIRTGRAGEAVPLLQAALRGGLEGANLYITRTELHALLGAAWRARGRADSAEAQTAAARAAWVRADPGVAARLGAP